MPPILRTAISCWVTAGVFLVSTEGLACQPLEPVPAQQLVEESIGVVRAKVTGADVIDIRELGIDCDSAICDILEVRLEVLEALKGNPADYEIIHAWIPTMCLLFVLPGWEYVFYLSENQGLIVPSEYSFTIRVEGQTPQLLELRRLMDK